MHGSNKDNPVSGPTQTASDDPDFENVNALIRKELSSAIQEQRISYQELDRRTTIPATTIGRIVSGHIASPPFDKILALYNALGLKLPYMQQMTAQFTLPELVSQGAAMLTFPARPSDSDIRKAESLLSALVNANILAVKSA